MLDNFDFEMEFSNLYVKYKSVSIDRGEYIYKFLTNDHSNEGYKHFLKQLNGEEYFFTLDVQYLLHKRALERLHKLLTTKYD